MAEVPIKSFHVSLVVIRETKFRHEVLLLKRTKTLVGEWCQIAGGIEEGEAAWQTALRELEEETGLKSVALYSADICEQFYEADRNQITIAPVFVAFVADSAKVSLNHEHSEHLWVGFAEAIEIVAFGGQRRVLSCIEDEFIKRKPSSHLLIKSH